LLSELKRLQLKVPALPVASAIIDRLSCLINNGSNQTELGASVVERALMYSELARRETFTKWPHGNYKYVLEMCSLLAYADDVRFGSDEA